MQIATLITASLLTLLLVVATAFAGPTTGPAKATFAVHCYDVGASALDSRPGVLSVERGWSGGREVDRVVYDPQVVTLDQLETWLKEADTYVSTLEHTPAPATEKEMSR